MRWFGKARRLLEIWCVDLSEEESEYEAKVKRNAQEPPQHRTTKISNHGGKKKKKKTPEPFVTRCAVTSAQGNEWKRPVELWTVLYQTPEPFPWKVSVPRQSNTSPNSDGNTVGLETRG